jgi:CDP-diacylglycerol--glycerol-3-phosphate 3-phosphatidyltransferase
LLIGGVVFLLGRGLDLFDGALARLTGKVTPFGALLDSVFDRLGEASLFVGLAIYGMRAGFPEPFTLFFLTALLLALILSQGVSYLRARGEGLGVFTRAGVMTRTERVVILGAGLIVDHFLGFSLIPWVLTAIAAVSCFTLFQRMFTIRKMLDKAG